MGWETLEEHIHTHILQNVGLTFLKFSHFCFQDALEQITSCSFQELIGVLSSCYSSRSLSEVNKFVGPSGAKLHEFERKIYLYIALKMSALLPSNSEKQSMNDVRQRERC